MNTQISARELYERGRNLRRAKLYNQALEDLRRASDDPNYAGQAQTQVGLCLRAMGRHEDAVAAFRYALHQESLSPAEAVYTYYLLGLSLEILGRPAEALEAFNIVRQEDPKFMDVEMRIKRLCGVSQGVFAKDLSALWGNLLANLRSIRR